MTSRAEERVMPTSQDAGGSTEESPSVWFFRSDSHMKPEPPVKKRRFRPFKAVRRLFTIRRRTRYDDASKSRSSTEIAGSSSSDISEPSQGLPSKNFSLSADSVFTASQSNDPRARPNERDRRLSAALSIPENLNTRRSLQSELFSKLKSRNVSVDDGLPRSPDGSTPPTTSSDVIMGEPLKRKAVSFESERSLYSVNSSELDDDYSCSPQTLSGFLKQRHHSTSSLDSSELDLDVVAVTESLDLSGPRHRVAIRPKARRRPSANKRPSQRQPTALTALSEESNIKRLQATLPIQVTTTTTSKPIGFDRPSDGKSGGDKTSTKSWSRSEIERKSSVADRASTWGPKPETKITEIKVEKTKSFDKGPFIEVGPVLERGPVLEKKVSEKSDVRKTVGKVDMKEQKVEKRKSGVSEVQRSDSDKKDNSDKEDVPLAGSVASRSKLFSQSKNNNEATKAQTTKSQPKSQSWRKSETSPRTAEQFKTPEKSEVTLRSDREPTDRQKRVSAHFPSQQSSETKSINKRFSTIEPERSSSQPSWISMARKKLPDDNNKPEPEVQRKEAEKTKSKPVDLKPHKEVEKTISTSERKSLFEKPRDTQKDVAKSVPTWKQKQLNRKEESKVTEPEPEVLPAWKARLNKNRENLSSGKVEKSGVKESIVDKKEAKKIEANRQTEEKCISPDSPKPNIKVMDLMKNFQKVQVS